MLLYVISRIHDKQALRYSIYLLFFIIKKLQILTQHSTHLTPPSQAPLD